MFVFLGMSNSFSIWPYLVVQCKDICVEIQDQFLKELRDLSEVS